MKKMVGVWSEKERNDDALSRGSAFSFGNVNIIVYRDSCLFYLSRKVDTFIIIKQRAKFKEQDSDQIKKLDLFFIT